MYVLVDVIYLLDRDVSPTARWRHRHHE